MIYLDHNSSTYILPHIYDEIHDKRDGFLANADAQHAAGRITKAYVEDGRSRIADLVGVKSKNIIFTGGATESNAMAMLSYIASGALILAFATEHKSVLKYASKNIRVLNSGVADLEALQHSLEEYKGHDNVVVACMYANNETGVISDPRNEVVDLCARYGAKLHIDASQCYGKGGRLSESQVSYASSAVLSGHKMHALKGVGALIFKDEMQAVLAPLMLGGHQELGLRPGTPNVEAIYSFGIAADYSKNIDVSMMKSKIMALEKDLSSISEINGGKESRLANTTNLYFPKVTDLQMFIEELSDDGVMISGMSACDSGFNDKSHVITAMYGNDTERANGSIRMSISETTSWTDIINTIEIIKSVLA